MELNFISYNDKFKSIFSMQTTVFKKITDVFLSFQVIKAIYLLNHNVWAKKYERKKWSLRDGDRVFRAEIQNISSNRGICCLRKRRQVHHSLIMYQEVPYEWRRMSSNTVICYLMYRRYRSILESKDVRKQQWLRGFTLLKESRSVIIQIPCHLIIQSCPSLPIWNMRMWCNPS